MTTVISATSRKGGVGKTTLATSLASILARESFSVLLVDVDPQSTAALALGVNPLAKGTAEWLLDGSAEFQEVQPGLTLLAGSPVLEQFGEEDGHILMQRLQATGHDYVVIDTSAGSTAISRCALACSDVVLVTSEPHPLALAGATTILDGLLPDKRRALVLSRVDPRKALHREIAAGAADAFVGTAVLTLRSDTRLERALAEGVPAGVKLKRGKALADLDHIATWLLNEEV